jgi:serine/threonine protein kinase
MSKFPDFSAHGYQVIEQLGQNTQGGRVAYRAQNKFGKQVVIKQFQVGGSWDGVTAIAREIEVLQGLKHRGIPAYIHSFETDIGFCLVTEYVNARTLTANRRFNTDEVSRIIVQLLEILVYLQQCVPPIVHRDIKPENILVDDDLNVYLIDFGFARIGTAANMSSVAAGSFGFMSPEQLRNLDLGKASDLYSLGMTLICLLGNIASTEIGEYIDEKNQLDRKKVESRLKDYNPLLVRWLYRLVKPSAADRYDDADEALDYLCEALQSKKPFKVVKAKEKLQLSTIIQSTWIPLAIISFVYAVIGMIFTFTKAPASIWLLLLNGIGMISLYPIFGEWLNKPRNKGFWSKFVVSGIYAISFTLAIYQTLSNITIGDSNGTGVRILLTVGIVVWSIANAWLSDPPSGNFPVSWIVAWAVSWVMTMFWVVRLLIKSYSGFYIFVEVFLIASLSAFVWVLVILPFIWIFSECCKYLLYKAGKWNATKLLFGTGLPAVILSLLVKFFFGL